MKTELKKLAGDKLNYLYSAVSALLFMLNIDVNFYPMSDGFDRVFSDLQKNGYSLSERSGNFFAFHLLIFPVVLVFFWFFYALTLREKKPRILTALSAYSALLLPFFWLCRGFNETNIFHETTVHNCILVIFAVVSLFTCIFKEVPDEGKLTLGILATMSETVAMGLLLNGSSLVSFVISHLYLVFLILLIVNIVLLMPELCKLNVTGFMQGFNRAVVWLPAVICLAAELVFILMARGVHVGHTFRYVCIIAAAFIALAAVCAFLNQSKANDRLPFLGSLVGILTVIAVPDAVRSISIPDYFRLFESGNTSAFADTVISGDIPGVNYFSAHLLSDLLDNLCYYILNKDYYGAVADNYDFTFSVVCCLILFLILRNLIKEEYAYLFAGFFPVVMVSASSTGLYFLTVLAMFAVIKKENFTSSILFWISALFGVLYSFDSGFGIGIGCIIVLILLRLTGKISFDIPKFAGSAVGVSFVALGIFFIGCVKEGVSFAKRFREFVSVSVMSNSTWAYTYAGPDGSAAFAFVYGVVPIVTVSILIYLIYRLKDLDKEAIPLYSLTMALSFLQLTAMSRTLVLYTLGNGPTSRLFPHFALMVASCIALMVKENGPKRALSFAGGFLITLFMQDALVMGIKPMVKSVPVIASELSIKYRELHHDDFSDKGRTVIGDCERVGFTELKNVMDTLLKEDETFVDFANVSGLYGLLKRERPFYVSQSPALLTNEFTQRMYIEEIERNGKARLAILPMKDKAYMYKTLGIPHSMRYYIAAEYIYRNYKPLCECGDYAVWVKNAYYDDFSLKAEQNGFEELPASYGSVQEIHTYDYGDYAWLWANKDSRHAMDRPIVCEPEPEDDGAYLVPAFEKGGGNYLAFSAEGGAGHVTVRINDEDNTPLAAYKATIKEGWNRYLIRISNDYSWYLNIPLKIKIEADEGIETDNIWILAGD
ncbi:MAG: hypothetical protein K6E19_00675 [Lachnospiraceae bacterium]|nr:hypothetical protein [Lachnospiraceae bacterium]